MEPGGQELLARIAALDPRSDELLNLGTKLRRDYAADLVAAALTLHELKGQSRKEIQPGKRDVFHPGRVRAIVVGRRLPDIALGASGDTNRIADLCTGIGGDLIALAAVRTGAGGRSRSASPQNRLRECGCLRSRRGGDWIGSGCAGSRSDRVSARARSTGAARRGSSAGIVADGTAVGLGALAWRSRSRRSASKPRQELTTIWFRQAGRSSSSPMDVI